MMWKPLGLDVDEYGDLLMLMAASGVLFLSENTWQGRRWTMPLRLSDAKPTDTMKKHWDVLQPSTSSGDQGEKSLDQLGVQFTLGRIAPPGVVERIMAGSYGFGRYVKCWKRGVLIELNQPEGAYLLIELRWRNEKSAEATGANKGKRGRRPSVTTGEAAPAPPVEAAPPPPVEPAAEQQGETSPDRGRKGRRSSEATSPQRKRTERQSTDSDAPSPERKRAERQSTDGDGASPERTQGEGSEAASGEAADDGATAPAEVEAEPAATEAGAETGATEPIVESASESDEDEPKEYLALARAEPAAEAAATEPAKAAPAKAEKAAEPIATEAPKPAESVRVAYVAVEIRARKADRSVCWATMLRVREVAKRVIDDFPGLSVTEEALCPGCLSSAKHHKDPMRWAAHHVTSRPLKCEKCAEALDLNMVLKQRAAPPTPLSLSLVPPTPPDEAAVGGPATAAMDPTAPAQPRRPSRDTSAKGAKVCPPPEHRFVASQLRLGKGIEATYRLHRLLGLRTESELTQLRAAEEQAIEDEVLRVADASEDEYGWTAADWLRYLKDELTQQPTKPRRDLSGAEGKPPVDVPDSGHPEGKALDDFVAHPLAVAAKLTRAHMLALRLYSTPAFAKINEALHFGCSLQRPHLYPATVANLCEAWKRLRQTAEEKAQLFTAFGALGVVEGTEKPVVWRVWNSAEELGEYKQRGGVELGVMSCFKTRAAAEKAAMRVPKAEVHTKQPSLLKIRTDLEGLVDISLFSVQPEMGECIYPPACYLEFRSEATVASMIDGQEKGRRQEVKFSIIDVSPQLAALPNK